MIRDLYDTQFHESMWEAEFLGDRTSATDWHERPHRRPDRPAVAVGNDQLLGVGLQLLLRLLQRLLHPLAALLGERPHGRRNGQRHGHRQAADVEPAGLQLPRNEQPENLVQETRRAQTRDALLATDAEHVQDAVGLQQQFRHARHRGAGPDDRERVRPRRSGFTTRR